MQLLPEVQSIDEFHHEVKVAGCLAKVMHGDYIRMRQASQGPGLACETFRERRVAAPLGRQDFEGHQPIELELPGLVHGTHAALADQVQNFQLGKVRSQFGRFGGGEGHLVRRGLWWLWLGRGRA